MSILMQSCRIPWRNIVGQI